MQKINQILNKIIKAKQLKILYFYSATNLDNKYSWNFFYKNLDNITNYLDTLTSLLKKKEIN